MDILEKIDNFLIKENADMDALDKEIRDFLATYKKKSVSGNYYTLSDSPEVQALIAKIFSTAKEIKSAGDDPDTTGVFYIGDINGKRIDVQLKPKGRVLIRY